MTWIFIRMHAVNNLYPWELQIQLWGAAGLKLAWERRMLVSKGETPRSLPCVRSWRVLTSSRTRSCRTCCRMCCLCASCMMPIRSSFLSVSLIRARPEDTKKHPEMNTERLWEEDFHLWTFTAKPWAHIRLFPFSLCCLLSSVTKWQNARLHIKDKWKKKCCFSNLHGWKNNFN